MALKFTVLFCFLAAFEINFIEALRKDYIYIASTRSYYKLHQKEVKWAVAKSTCELEDAVLFYPESEAEVIEIQRAFPSTINFGIYVGMSDSGKLGDYRTIDGRPISQVFNNWYPGEPEYPNNIPHCGILRVDIQKLFVRSCDRNVCFVCKRQPGTEKTTAVEATINDNASYKIAALERLVATLGGRLAALEVLEQEAMVAKLQAANQTAALEMLEREVIAMKLNATDQPLVLERRITEAITNQAETLERLATNQTVALERIAEAGANQDATLERIAEFMQQHTEVLKLQGAIGVNQTAALNRQALALEKIASPQEENSQ